MSHMSGIISGLCFLLAIMALLLVIGQVDTLQAIGKANTSGGLKIFFDTPVMLILVLTGGILVIGAMAVLLKISRLI
jgi:hypothetical protein